MKFHSAFVGICIFFIFTFQAIGPCHGQDEGGEGESAPAESEKTCSKWIFDLIGIVFEAVGPCLAKSFQIRKISEVVTRVFCLVKCIITELGLLDEEGKLEGTAAAIFFGENFPSVLRNPIVEKADPCFKLADDFNGKEYYCKSYAAFTQCAAGVVIQEMVPYVIGCFGSPFIAAGLNAAFGFLTSAAPSGRSLDPKERRLEYKYNNRTRNGYH